jgi:hypothetical protein
LDDQHAPGTDAIWNIPARVHTIRWRFPRLAGDEL